MGITQLIDSFYIHLPKKTYAKAPVMGQICRVPILHLNQIPIVFDVERADPEEHYATKFSIRNLREDDFRAKGRLPIKMLNLRATEVPFLHKAKKRPVVIVATEPTLFDDIAAKLKPMGRRHLQEDCIVVAPIYSIEIPEKPGGFPPIMTARIRALRYKQFFYLPVESEFGSVGGIVRLDRLQVINSRHPAVYSPLPYALGEDALAALLGMVHTWLGIEPDSDHLALMELLGETLPVIVADE